MVVTGVLVSSVNHLPINTCTNVFVNNVSTTNFFVDITFLIISKLVMSKQWSDIIKRRSWLRLLVTKSGDRTETNIKLRLTCTRASLRSRRSANSSRVNTSGYCVFSNARSSWCSWNVVNVVRLLRNFRGLFPPVPLPSSSTSTSERDPFKSFWLWSKFEPLSPPSDFSGLESK